MLFNSKNVRVFQVWLQGGYIQSANGLSQGVLPGAQHHELVFEEDQVEVVLVRDVNIAELVTASAVASSLLLFQVGLIGEKSERVLFDVEGGGVVDEESDPGLSERAVLDGRDGIVHVVIVIAVGTAAALNFGRRLGLRPHLHAHFQLQLGRANRVQPH